MDVAMISATTEPPRDVTAGDVQAVVDAAAALVSRLMPGEVPLSWTGGIWAAFDRLERLGAAAKTLLAGRVAESGVWERAGFAHPAEYLAQRAGTTVANARETLAASRRLADLPATESRVRDGALSTPQLQQITDAASHNPDAETELLDKATDGSTLHELRDACGRAKAAADKDPADRDKRLRAQRRLRQRRETDGGWSLWARGTVRDAATFNAAIEQIIDDLLQDAHDNGEPLTREQAAYDALIEMANRINTTDWTDLDQDDDPTGETGPGDESDSDDSSGGDDDTDTDGDDTGESHSDYTDTDGDDTGESHSDSTERTDPDDPGDDPGDDLDGEPGGGVDGGWRSGDAGDLVETGRGDADVSGRRVGNGTGFAGAVHRQDDTSSWPGNDEPSSRGKRTDNTSSRPGSDRTPDPRNADGSSRTPDNGNAAGSSRTRDDWNADGVLNRRQRRRRRPRRKAQPYLGIIRADLAALRRGHPVDGEVVEIAGLGPISVLEARELLGGDAVLQLVLTDGVHANVTNLRR